MSKTVGKLWDEHCKEYSDRHRFLHGNRKRTKGKGNGLRYSSEMIIILKKKYPELEDDFDEMIIDIAHKAWDRSKNYYYRHPTWHEPTGHDDYYALAHANKKLAKRILKMGRSSFWTYGSWPRHFYMRFPAFIPHMKICAGEELSVIEKKAWCFAVNQGMNAPKTDQDQWMLTWHLVDAAVGKGEFFDEICKKWYRKLRKPSPNRLNPILEDYFQDNEHPLVLHLDDTIKEYE